MMSSDYRIQTFPGADTATELSANSSCVAIDDTVDSARPLPAINKATFAQMSFEDRFSTLLEVLDVSKRREASYQAELHEFAATVEYRKSAVIVTKRILTAVALRKAHTDKSQPELVPKGATSSFLEQSTKLTPETRDYFRKVRSAVTPLDREFTSAAHQVAVRTAGFHINSTQDHEEHEAYSDLLLYATGLAPFAAERVGTGILSDM